LHVIALRTGFLARVECQRTAERLPDFWVS
jgi:hypothetical protein